EGADQVDYLDTGLQQVGGGGQLFVGGSLAVDDRTLLLADGAGFVNRVAQHVHDATQGLGAYRYLDRLAGVVHRQAALEAFGGAQRDRTHDAVAELLLHFQGQAAAVDDQRVIHLGHGVAGKFHVDNGADDLYDTSATHL